MTGFLDRLNLRPFEKRLVVVIAVVVFVVMNFWFVVPRFSDWNRVKDRMSDAQRKLERYQREVADMAKTQARIKELEGEEAVVPAEDQAFRFRDTVLQQAAASKVIIQNAGNITPHTNVFFLEQTQNLAVQSGEAELVDFLHSLGAGNSLIRVRDLTLRPDPPRHQLNANLKLVASYQKKLPAPAAKSSAAGSKTAPPTGKKS